MEFLDLWVLKSGLGDITFSLNIQFEILCRFDSYNWHLLRSLFNILSVFFSEVLVCVDLRSLWHAMDIFNILLNDLVNGEARAHLWAALPR